MMTKFWKRSATTDCESRRALLSRYLDNDLHGNAAAHLAAHLHGCVSCRSEFEAMRAQRAMLSAATLPRGSAAARARVLARFEQSVRESSQNTTRMATPRKTTPQRRPALRPALRLAFAAGACALVGGSILLLRTKAPVTPIVANPTTSVPAVPAVPAATVTRPLPGGDDLHALLALHDARMKAVLPAPTPRPSIARAAANPAHSHRHNHFAASSEQYAATSNTSDASARDSGTDAVGDAPPLAPDELPEAL